jgi:acyl-CoA thioesterase
MYANLAADTEVPGRYRLTLSDHWDYLLPSGGVVMTCALRAAEAELADPRLRFGSATTVFCTPIRPTALVIDVTVLRRGGSTAQVRVALRERDARPDPEDPSDNARGMELLATFVRDRRGPDVRGVAFPAVRSVADALPVEDDAPNNPYTRFRFYQQIETRIADGERLWTPELVEGPARYARWFRYREPQRDAEGRLDRLALPPLVDTMPTALQRAIGPSGYRFYAPSLDLTTYVVDDTDREWLLVTSTVRRARLGWAIGDAEVWDDQGKLIAYGAQAMYLHGLAGEPPVIDATSRT